MNSLQKYFLQKELIGFNLNPDSCLRRNDLNWDLWVKKMFVKNYLTSTRMTMI